MVCSEKDGKLADIQHVPFWWHTIDLGDGVVTPVHSSLAEQKFRSAGITQLTETFDATLFPRVLYH